MKILGLILLSFFLGINDCTEDHQKKVISDKNMDLDSGEFEVATFGGGCFWCVEAVFQELVGVAKVTSGYMGGDVPDPSYEEVCRGTTGHAEVVQIQFDSDKIDYSTLLEVFWSTHDPTTLNRQGYDVGTQYRSIIFYHSEQQRLLAEDSKTKVAPQLWDDPIVTEIVEAETFYEAEEYHQDFYSLNPGYGYCRAIINPKMEKFRKRFADKLKASDP